MGERCMPDQHHIDDITKWARDDHMTGVLMELSRTALTQ